MAYDYVKRAYGVSPVVGERVRHTEINKLGTIAREKLSAGHHVQVRFDGEKFASPCHPTALEYLGRAERASAAAGRHVASSVTGRRADLQCGFMDYDDFGNN